jgi:hypothetical protein
MTNRREPDGRQIDITHTTTMFKVTVQSTPVKESNWRVVATGTWTPGQRPELEDQLLPGEVVATLFDVTPSATDKSGRNEVRCGETAYAVVFRRISK